MDSLAGFDAPNVLLLSASFQRAEQEACGSLLGTPDAAVSVSDDGDCTVRTR